MCAEAVASTKPVPWRLLGRVAGGGAAVLLAATAFIGFLHTKSGRPLLAALGLGCPVGHPTVEAAVESREKALQKLRGDELAPARPALGFALETTTEADVTAWATKGNVACKTENRGFDLVTCKDVPSALLEGEADMPTVSTLTFAFAPNGSLLTVDSMRRNLTPEDAARFYQGRRAAVSAVLRGPGDEVGEGSAENLAKGMMHSATTTYRYRDYLLTLTTMNLGPPSGIVLREQFGSANKPRM